VRRGDAISGSIQPDTDEAKEGTTAFLKKRRPDFRGKRSR
jgi:1,4-dihydroxy-2-naphthoyl-CoA synthase